MKDQKHVSTKFYQEDFVQRIGHQGSFGIVLRCWHDAEDVSPAADHEDPMMRQLQPGEVGVSFFTNGGEREILPESHLRLVDRTIQPGDFCKRAISNVQSGVVTSVKVKGRLEHAISGEPIEEWKTLDELESSVDAEIGDYVIYDDWIGQVIELCDESLIEVSTGQLVRLPELGSRLSVGERGTDILPAPSNGVHNLFGFGFFLGSHRQDGVDTVISIKHTVYAVAWLAVNQSLPSADATNKRRPQRFWYGEDVGKLTVVRGRSDMEMRVGDRVYLKDNAGAPYTMHGQGGDGDPVRVQIFMVVETQTTLEILWQNGEKETLKSTEIIPYLNPDEYDCWPGDHVIWKCEGEQRHAIVQTFDAAKRTATILLADTGAVELASVLELDPHGAFNLAAVISPSTSEGLGVRRGDFVFIHREGTTNGFEEPSVPRIGELEAWVRESPVTEDRLTGWREEMAGLGASIATRVDGVHTYKMIHPVRGNNSPLWLGEVTDLNIDGSVEITHPDSTVRIYPLERLTRLYDGIEQLEDNMWGDGIYGIHSEEADQTWLTDDDNNWQPDPNNQWKESGNDDAEEYNRIDMDSREWIGKSAAQRFLRVTSPNAPTSPQKGHVPFDETSHTGHTSINEHVNLGSDFQWKRFDILPSVPLDHAFFSSPPAQPSKLFLSRLTREYRVLSSSLPESIIVRVYEDRTDLLRSLILGPANTPYEDAPFMIDWMLDSNFPHSPPIAHFHSWTNGNGRGYSTMVVNPNLYEEGKVCLSILGTWAGDRDEVWSAARSSLLQAFVSIQGLVLVKEPWFCEPAYDKLRGTEEGSVNSRLYNEKAYVLSRAFVLRVLETPLGGLDAEIKWLYYQNHRLQKVLQDAQALIEKSERMSELNEADCDLAVPRLTAGGIIALERTLNKLQAFLNSHYSL